MEQSDLDLLKSLCRIHAPSGRESTMRDFILDHVANNSQNWHHQPEVITGGPVKDCVILSFGKPRTAVFAHMDSVGYTAGKGNHLIRIGSPKAKDQAKLTGIDDEGNVFEAILHAPDKDQLIYSSDHPVSPGTSLTFKSFFRTGDGYVQSCSLDNRIGVFNALKQAETLKDGALVFSCQEETGGGSVHYLARYLFEEMNIMQALISDVTWATDSVHHGQGVVISRRDSGIPRQTYVDHILKLADKSGINYQIEVESAGGSDGNVIHHSAYPIDWCFIGPPEDFVHSPDEKVFISDIEDTIALYRHLLKML